MFYITLRNILNSAFIFLSKVASLYASDPKLLYCDSSDEEEDGCVDCADADDDVSVLAPEKAEDAPKEKESPFVRTKVDYEWTPENTIKITLNIIVGSNGLGVFLMPNGQQPPPPPPRAPTPPPAPIPEPVDETPTLDEFHVDVNFGGAPAPSDPADTTEKNDFELETTPLRAIPDYYEVYSAPAAATENEDTDDDMPELIDVGSEMDENVDVTILNAPPGKENLHDYIDNISVD